MRSNTTDPHNPWPRDMTISVDDRPSALLELLWIRDAYDLPTDDPHLPPPLIDAPGAPKPIDSATRHTWATAWRRIWPAALTHAGKDADPTAFERLQQTADGSAERAALLHQLIGPNWCHDMGEAPLDGDAFSDWLHRDRLRLRATHPAALQSTPERRDLDALIPAWRAGLTKIITVPCEGEFVQQVGANALLMTAATRRDSDSYRRALASFA